MKPTLNLMLFVLFFAISFVSCNNEELFIEPTAEVVLDTPADDTPVEDTNSGTYTNTTACDFTLDAVQSGDTVIINCIMDLGGQTINLPANVMIVYEGGDIINGTINFGDNSIISGELLNASLTLGGSYPQMKDTTFNFDPQRWGIVEGETTSEIAYRNKEILQEILDKCAAMNILTFNIDKMDAYFEVENNNVYRAWENAINIPSNLILKMSNNTHFRVFPNSSSNYALMAVYDARNVTIDGGNFHGDRDLHDYSGGAQEHGHCLQIRSGKNILVKNASFSDAMGDGIDINSNGFAFETNYDPSMNILITNNTLDSNRRNNLTVTDGRDIIIENNLFLNASQNTALSTGTAPGAAIDVECVRQRDAQGVMVYYQIAKDIIIRNNIEKNSRDEAFNVFIGYSVIIENNTTEKPISYSYANGTIIRGNTITASSSISKGTGIIAGKPDGGETIYNNEVSNNTINGYPTGITIYNKDAKITDNHINDFLTGIFIIDATGIEVSRNIMQSSKNSSKGIFINLTSLNNVLFSENTINVAGNPFSFSQVNNALGQDNFKIQVEKNTFSSSNNSVCLISGTKGLSFSDNIINSGLQVFNATNLSFNANIITSNNNDGIYLREINKNVTLTNNKIDVPNNYECIKIQNTTNAQDVINTNNSCQ